ncbi:NAD(P)-dependent alcohol dehydrogenase [Flavihumibacter sp. CACIAM 22H1]|uniref:NAD(P)-dependent alcohol dehydrogenase n=1 Tax=Flavihumibacter sp. CACIAM 22H1 TaxID=1812911 RepID=UPI0007A92618|nr:NAD(P)-dependent alcohol dehydrogenase [Flavihumibacter sp. CACIAM 22H1]KYP13608.1 MAG: NADPH:quinone oxidoreductase [Flavihumibacter sp. CACIAM 22H1]
MRAAVRYSYCSPDKLEVRELPIPSIRTNEVLVKVKASTVSQSDCGVLTGKPYAIRLFSGLLKPSSPITGTDFSGIVVARGADVKEYQIGDMVYGFFDEGLSTHAEYVAVPVSKAMLKKPDHITFEQAAASLEGAHYAYYFLDKLSLNAGDSVLVNGGTGAIGNAAIQFLKHKDIRVVATCEEPYIDYLYKMGVDYVIDYTRQDFTQFDEQFDAVFDAVGKSSFGKCKRLLKPVGVYISSELGPYWQNPLLALAAPFMPGKKVKFPLPLSINRSLEFIHERIIEGAFTPLIDRYYLFDDISEAFSYVQTGQKKGNVILRFN